MTDPQRLGSILKEKTPYVTNGTNVSKYLNKDTSNVNNVRKSPYALRPDFKEYTPEATLSLEMVKYFSDEDSHAFYWKLCLREGEERARFLFDQFKGIVKEKATSRFPVKDIRKCFVFMYKKGLLPGQRVGKKEENPDQISQSKHRLHSSKML